MTIRDSLERVVNKTERVMDRSLSTLRTNIVPEIYYTGLALTAGAVIDDYTAWGLLKSTGFAALSAGTIKGIQYISNQCMPCFEIHDMPRAEALLHYGIAAGTVAVVCTAEALALKPAGDEGQTTMQAVGSFAEMMYLQILSYGILETGLHIRGRIKRPAVSGKKTVQKRKVQKADSALSYASAACALGLGLATAVDAIDIASLDAITPFYAEGIPSLSVDSEKLPEGMELKQDLFGTYATVHLNKGESLYSAVVLNHTDFLEHEDVMDAASGIMRRSFGVRSLWKGYNEIQPEDELRIPASMLSEQYKTGFKKPTRAKMPAIKPTNGGRLSGVYVILDSGHGGNDSGASANNVVEDEVAYDITSRAGTLLEQMGANVHYLVEDKSTGHAPSSKLTPDKDEILLTTPPYQMKNTKDSVNLRVYLTNTMYDELIQQGVSPDAIVYTSFHVDALSPHSSGMMVYYPEASLRKSHLKKSGKPYTSYHEFNHDRIIEIEHGKEQSEAQSYALAQLIITSANSDNLSTGIVPVRGSIHRGRQTYVPAVLRWNPVPQKVLVEVGNCANKADALVLRDKDKRQQIAQAYTDALVAYYQRGR